MCGINGFNWKDESLVKAMNDSIKHRGPDDSGYYTDDSISLGHRRLSVIDLSKAGHQPMSNEDGSIWIVHNGEIYNFKEIRKILEKKGFKFKSNTDTEVIIHSYQEWGKNCVKKFNGMWAFCIYDKKEHRLILSRDRLGKKPLYYYWDGEKFIFSSEIKGILKHKIEPKINKEAIDFYFTIGFIPSPMSIYQKIFKLEPRQLLLFDTTKKKISKEYYYKIPQYRPVYDENKLMKDGKDLLKDATRLRLIADVPVGAFLSGGLDSSTVVATMSDFVDLKNLHTFSIGFEGKYDESKYVKIVKDEFQTIHHHKFFREDDFENLIDNISYFYDEPFGDFSNFPAYDVSELARRYVTVSLSGDGGDEIFGGYSVHELAARVVFIKKIPRFLRKIAYCMLPANDSESFQGKLKEILRLSLIEPETFCAEIGARSVYKPSPFKKWSSRRLRRLLRLSKNNLVEAIIKYDQFYNTLGDNYLVKVDRASMAHALEVRCPFLDYRFIDYSARIPVEWKVNILGTKILMRKIIKKIVPKTIVERGKQGFIPPLAVWINKEKYASQTEKGLEELFREGIINKKWYDFFRNRVFRMNDMISKNYRISMFLFWKWYERRMRARI